ncbi:FAD-dependent monooxygenase [Melittangium boletus]|uniref:FAD-binding domain-containing protein n=1 Tax=Melittangium boletus DSM 14713 TaxID=1294270 RepID=A0A250ISK8_9BACT|nr:FAD-dependent monooxygenase [Melittangium boletus]ATB34151.1 hypothetical protein MEBOL_007652 [Melittangium boletus DSM 14713]
MEHVDVVIIGSGPAGISAALSLQKLAPELMGRTLVLEKGTHPREKLCGGGVTALVDPLLQWLDIPWERFDSPHMAVRTAHLRFEGCDVTLRFPGGKAPVFRVFQRSEFDARLVDIARERGVRIQEDTSVLGMERVAEGLVLRTSKGDFHAKVVIGADGSKSLVRRWMDLPSTGQAAPVSRLMEVLTPEVAERTPEFTEQSAVFDFSRVPDGMQGYLWDFPSFVEGRPMMNRGIFDSRLLHDRPLASLVPMLDDYLSARDRSLAECELKGHPERYYEIDGTYSVPRILLVGDAAGVDPMAGEGISWGMKYGPLAAEEVRQAFATGDFSFKGYSQRVAESEMGQGLAARVRLARFLYSRSRRFYRIAWPVLRQLTRGLNAVSDGYARISRA